VLPGRGADVWILAAWFGLFTGLTEGVGLLVFQKLGWLNWNIARVGVAADIIWVSALVNLMLCLAAALPLLVMGRMFPRWQLSVAVFVYGLFLFLDWCLLSGKIRGSGAGVLALGLATVALRSFHRRPHRALRLWRRSLPVLAGLFVVAVVGVEGGQWWQERQAVAGLPEPPANAPNVLLIVVDTLRADHVGAYGYQRATTKNLDRLAGEGVLFENAIATSSWTLPSHASLLTGRYPYEHGAVRNEFDDRHPTLSEYLRDRGYRTGAISANTIWFTRGRGFGRGFVHFEDFFGSVGDMFARTLYGRKIEAYVLVPLGFEDDPGRKRASHVTSAALRWIGTGRDRPFFLFLNYYDAHDPYLPPQPFRSRFSKVERPGGRVNSHRLRYYPKLTAEQLQEEVDAYDGGIAYADHHIGELLAGLKQRGLDENTIVVVTSDHGESFGEHGLMVHINGLYRETLHVPMIFRWPGRLPAGARVALPVSIATFPATILEILGSTDQQVFPGPSVARLWREPGTDLPGHFPLAELAQFKHEEIRKSPCYSGSLKSLVSPEWQYIVHEKTGEELYDWKGDPQQLNNVAQSERARPVAAEFRERLRNLVESARRSASN
jgi:arylsulfatase A-like enzyme